MIGHASFPFVLLNSVCGSHTTMSACLENQCSWCAVNSTFGTCGACSDEFASQCTSGGYNYPECGKKAPGGALEIAPNFFIYILVVVVWVVVLVAR